MELNYQHALGVSAQPQAAIGGEISRLCCFHVSPPSRSNQQPQSISSLTSLLSPRHSFVVGQRRGSEIDTEAFAPHRNRAVFRQVHVRPKSVVLIADVALYGPQVDKACARHAGVVGCVVGSHHINVNVGTVRCPEVREANKTTTILNAVDSRGALGGMQNAMERSRFKRLWSGAAVRGWELLNDVLIDEKPLGPKSIPGDKHRDEQNGDHNFRDLVFHYRVSFLVRSSVFMRG